MTHAVVVVKAMSQRTAWLEAEHREGKAKYWGDLCLR